MPKGVANARDLRNGSKPVPLLDRIMAHHYVDENGCWIWTAARNELGYGHLTIGAWLTGKIHTRKAYAVAYEELVGPVPDGLELDRLCRVPACINPAHLEPVTHRENTRRGEQGQWQRNKTHCPQGHPYDEKNTYMVPGDRWHRRCRACRAAAERRRTAEKNTGGQIAQDRTKGSEQGRHRSNGNGDHGRSDRDPSVLASSQAVSSGRAVTFARAARPAHVRGAS